MTDYEDAGPDILRGRSGLEYRRHPGASTVNIYDVQYDGREVDVFTLGQDVPTHENFREAVATREACLAGEHEADDSGFCPDCGEPTDA